MPMVYVRTWAICSAGPYGAVYSLCAWAEAVHSAADAPGGGVRRGRGLCVPECQVVIWMEM